MIKEMKDGINSEWIIDAQLPGSSRNSDINDL